MPWRRLYHNLRRAALRLRRQGIFDFREVRVGRILRAASLDELPQLLNVLAGDMSLIGPRPPLPHEVHLAHADWQRVLALRPGITGVAQLTYGLNRVDARAMRELDLEYLKRRSLKMDAKLLLRTFVMLTRQVKRTG
jgi:lipopolysaccharide/colanic/teichoic acid biosynthesis glycosyltransferase